MVEEDRSVSDGNPAQAADHAHDIYTVANIITVLRLMLVPYFFSVLLTGTSNTLAFVLFTLAASTDWLDGQIARRTGTVTVIGKAIDPLVDRLLIASGVIGLYIEGRMPLWVVVVLVARDGYLLYGAWRLEHYRLRMPVTFIGKTTTAMLLAGFAWLILGWPVVPGVGLIGAPAIASYLPGLGESSALAGMWFVYAGVLLSLSTAVQYTFLARRMVRQSGA